MTDTLTLTQYQTRLPTFEGPLDLLLRLIERQKLSITEVSLVAVTDQFLAYVETLEETSSEIIAEFTTVGARLTLLKSRSLLPRPPAPDAPADDDPDDLVEQLRAYKQVKDVARVLGERREAGVTSFGPTGRVVAQTAAPATTRLMRYDAAVLVRAIRRRLSTVTAQVQTIRQRRIISIREMTDRVLDMIAQRRRVPFRAIMAGTTTRSEMATAFLAVLVLVRRRIIDAEQDGLFSEINLAKYEGIMTDDPNAIDDDEFIN